MCTNMIINTDDIKYANKGRIGPLIVPLKDLPTNEEDMTSFSGFGLCAFLLSVYIVEARLLEIDPYLVPSDAYYLYMHFNFETPFLEMEEKIRKIHRYKSWYEQQTGRKI